MFGKFLIYLSSVTLLLSCIFYFISGYKKNKSLNFGRWLFFISSLLIIASTLYLLSNILSHNYQFTYIWENSSNYLEPYLLVSSFYAGQEGSFLLWLLLFAILGFFVMSYSKKHEYESLNMGFFTLIMFFIALMLVFKSPFNYLWESFKDGNIIAGNTPANGRGLNPVLENYWMSIHPPILFAGYAILSIPFIFSLTGLIKKDFTNWLKFALPWAFLGGSILGLGIMLGGFWAYETLGWGGFWGWDPVENSSLLPWLTIMTFIHTAAIQRTTKSMVRTNITLAIISFILVLYATFLTRSGILGDASVHSFADPGKAVYLLLIGILVINLLIGAIAFILRSKSIHSEKLNMNISSREFVLSISSLILIIAIVLIFLGTNWSVITDFLGMKKSKIDTSFFNIWILPVAFIIFLLNGISLYLNWKATNLKSMFRSSIISIIVTIIITFTIVISGLNNIKFIIFTLVVIYSLIVNFEYILRNLRKNPLRLGGFLSHAGFSIFMIGVIVSNNMQYSEDLKLSKGKPVTVNNYKITLKDKIETEKPKTDRQKFIYRIELENISTKITMDPVIFWSNFNNMQSPIIEPGIKNTFLRDIYLVLKSSDVQNPLNTLSFQKGQKTQLIFDSTISIEFVGYDMAHKHLNNLSQVTFGVIVKYTKGDEMVKDTLYTNLESKSVFKDMNWKPIKLTNYDVSFIRFIPQSENISQSEIVLAFKPTDAPFIEPNEILFCNISFKPLMSFVWIGVILITFGFIISIFNHKIINK